MTRFYKQFVLRPCKSLIFSAASALTSFLAILASFSTEFLKPTPNSSFGVGYSDV